MKIADVLNSLDLGSSVAEFDQMIDRHFVMTSAFQDLIYNKGDIVAGDKGAGKTTLYKYLQQKYTSIPQLKNVEVVAGFNPSGNPVFRKLIQPTPYSEGQYQSFWKAYILSLVGNWLLRICDGAFGQNTRKLDALLFRSGLRSKDTSVETIFSRLNKTFRRLISPTSASIQLGLHESGLPSVTPKLDFGSSEDTETWEDDIWDYDEGLALLNSALNENDITVWVLLDRLDEAFTGYSEIERPALRALLRVYLDLLAFDRIGLKLFVRKDLFRKIVQGGFVNLTHISARKIEIIWDPEDLFALLCRRIKASEEFLRRLPSTSPTDKELFDTLFPEKLNRNRSTWKWMLTQIKDGNQFVAPRNLVDFVNLAIEEQARYESRNPREYNIETPMIEVESLKRALIRLSKKRVEDTLLAEATDDIAVLIKGFIGQQSEQNDEMISNIFHVPLSQAKDFAEILVNIGFFERTNEGYKIPILYRSGLEIKD